MISVTFNSCGHSFRYSEKVWRKRVFPRCNMKKKKEKYVQVGTFDKLPKPYLKLSMKKTLTIKDFMSVVPFDEIERVMGKRMYKKFGKWMSGQTMSKHGVYPDDLDRFLRGLPIID